MTTDDIQHRIRSALSDRYEVGEPLGVGGMATVFRARDLRHARDVAIKVLRPELAEAIGPDRFQREIYVAAQLQHPNVLPLHDSGEADGLLYYVMPLVEGRTLADQMRPEGLPLDDALRLGCEIADGLASAHAAGVVHRDVKPGNILLSGGHAVIADFGLASSDTDPSLSQSGSSLGTPLYMSPEQAAGEDTSSRSDVYSLGCVLQELVTGAPPFSGKTLLELAKKHEQEPPPPLRSLRPDAPLALERLVARCLAKQPSERFADAGELASALAAVKVELDTGEVVQAGARKTRRVVVVAGLLLVALAFFLVRSMSEAEERRWIDEVALPGIEAACDERNWGEAFDLALQVEALVPDHPRLAQLWTRFSGTVLLESDPSGAKVSRRPVDDDEVAWMPLGTTPVEVRLPHGFHRIRFEKPDHLTTEVAGHWYYLRDQPTRLARAGEVPEGMLLVPGGTATLNIPGLDHLQQELPGVLMDRHEVTNAQWAAFVDAGGYEDESLWTDPLVRDGVELSLAEARAAFIDKSEQLGPATWVAGDIPEGREQHPVTGVSWFEARAYCRWAGRELPTLWHWNRAAETRLSAMVVPKSNFGGVGTLPVGEAPGRTAYGLADMGGNAREWCRNPTAEGERVILGGGWDDRTYMFNDFFAQDPWDRSRTNGLRTSIDFEPVDASLLEPLDVPFRDFSLETPASDEVFAVYRGLFDYDPLPLAAEVLYTDDSADDFRAERVAYDLPYGERTEAWLYLPKKGDGPFPTIVYFPGSNAIHSDSSDGLARPWIQFLMKQGYAVIHPIYKGTYERGTELASDYPDTTTLYRDHVIWWGKDFRRAVDYVESRPECDASRIGYLGASWGGALGPLMCAIEPRIQSAVLYVAGLLFQASAPEVDVFHYVPRVTIPVLMLNGRYDHFFPVDTSQEPLFELLGTPPSDKRYFLTEEGHSVPFEDVVRETLAWYGKTL
jgi:formylglycine-generating enzyme required for sulfatase activity/dienelactone hydrolase